MPRQREIGDSVRNLEAVIYSGKAKQNAEKEVFYRTVDFKKYYWLWLGICTIRVNTYQWNL